MSKHTPGPWQPMEGSDGMIRGIRGRHGPESVNVINWNGISRPTTSTGQANGRLIVAAPQMLEALLDCRRALEIANFSQELQVVDAAITKATGEA